MANMGSTGAFFDVMKVPRSALSAVRTLDVRVANQPPFGATIHLLTDGYAGRTHDDAILWADTGTWAMKVVVTRTPRPHARIQQIWCLDGDVPESLVNAVARIFYRDQLATWRLAFAAGNIHEARIWIAEQYQYDPDAIQPLVARRTDQGRDEIMAGWGEAGHALRSLRNIFPSDLVRPFAEQPELADAVRYLTVAVSYVNRRFAVEAADKGLRLTTNHYRRRETRVFPADRLGDPDWRYDVYLLQLAHGPELGRRLLRAMTEPME